MIFFKNYCHLRSYIPSNTLTSVSSDIQTPRSQFKPGFHMIATIAAIAEKKTVQRSQQSYGNPALDNWSGYWMKHCVSYLIFFLREKAFRVELNCFTALSFLVFLLDERGCCKTCVWHARFALLFVTSLPVYVR